MKKGILLLVIILQSITSLGQINKPKNVLFITIDDMNDWVKPFGGNSQAITPNMEKIAKKSTIFKNAYCSYPLCGPSRASLFTGKNPTTTKVYDNSGKFRSKPGNENVITLPQYFKKHGYETLSSGKVFHHGRGKGATPDPGSDPISWDIQRKGKLGTPYPPKEDKNPLKINFKIVKSSFDFFPLTKDNRGKEVTTKNTEDWKNADYIVKYMNQKHDKPFFAACGIYKPHLPLYAPKKYFDMYDLDKIKLPYTGEDLKNFDDLSDVTVPGYHKKFHNEILRVNGWKQYVRAYLANLTFADAVLGHLLDGLENSPVKNNTIIVIMGDHGWSLGEKQQWKKNRLWEEATKTPLLIYDPSAKSKGQICTRVVSLVDVYPTLLSLTGLPHKKDLDGFDISPLINQPNKRWNSTVITSRGEDEHALRDQNFRYIQQKDKKGKLIEELYNHKNDPNEFYNLAAKLEYKTLIKKFRVKLKDIINKNNIKHPSK